MFVPYQGSPYWYISIEYIGMKSCNANHQGANVISCQYAVEWTKLYFNVINNISHFIAIISVGFAQFSYMYNDSYML